MVTIADQRARFELPGDVTYLNCAYMAPQAREVREAGEAAVRRKSRPWTIGPADFFDDAERIRALFAALVGGDADGVAIVPSVSYGVGIAAANLPLVPGQRVLVLAEQFPSNVYPWRDATARAGAELVTVPRPADGDWTPALLAHLDERAAVVAVPHCHWTDGSLLDLERVGAAARDTGAALVVDGTQSIGALPFDVGRVRPDFLVAAAYKWLLGPYGIGVCWAAPDRRDGRPIEHGWITRAGSEDFAGLVDYRDDLQPGARRYDVGERSNFVLLPMVRAALELLTAWEVSAIAETIEELTGPLADGAGSLGFDVSPAGLRAGHVLGLRSPAGLPPDLPARLASAGVHVSARGSAIRVSPNVYNNRTDIDRLLDELRVVV